MTALLKKNINKCLHRSNKSFVRESLKKKIIMRFWIYKKILILKK